jgi:TnpA family transposase
MYSDREESPGKRDYTGQSSAMNARLNCANILREMRPRSNTESTLRPPRLEIRYRPLTVIATPAKTHQIR